MYLDIKMIKNKYHTVKTGPKSNKKIVEYLTPHFTGLTYTLQSKVAG
jgi:hypothetical protein